MTAIEARAAWMREMGFSRQEITDACLAADIDLAAELENLRYARALGTVTPSADVLRRLAVKREDSL